MQRYGSLMVCESFWNVSTLLLECTALFRQEKTMLDIEAPVTVCGEFLANCMVIERGFFAQK